MSKKNALKDYVEVKDRIKLYKEDNPDFRIKTEVLNTFQDGDVVVIKATLYKSKEELLEGAFDTTGIAEETRDAGYINKTSHYENCETSAIGRALANADYSGSDKRPSAEEMDKVDRTKKAKAKKSKPKKKEEPEKTEVSDDGDEDIISKINEFEDEGELVDWFNGQLNDRKGKDKDSFRENYLPSVRERMEELE